MLRTPFLLSIALTCAALLAWPTIVVANAGGGEGHGEAAAPAEGAKAGEAKALPEWVELQGRLQVLKAKVVAKEKIVADLITAKNVQKNEAQALVIVNDLKREHRELLTSIEEYDRVRSLLRYRYPEKGLKDDRAYQRFEAKPIEELESQIGMDGKIRQTMSKLRRQYNAPEARTPASDTSATSAVPTRDAERERVLAPATVSK